MNLNQTITQLRTQYALLGETLETLVIGVGSPGNITNIRHMTNPPRLRTPANTGRVGTRAVGRVGTTAPHTRTLSPAGRRAIARAQKVRWAKMRASNLQVVGRGKKVA